MPLGPRRLVKCAILCLAFAAPAAAQNGIITGTVTDDATGLPIAGIVLNIYNSSSVLLQGAVTNASGVYSTSLPAGAYKLHTNRGTGFYGAELYNDIPCPGSCPLASATLVTVAAGATTSNINFTLTLGGRLSGTVTSASTGLPLSASLLIYTASGSVVTSVGTNASGQYTIGGLLAGNYLVQIFSTVARGQMYNGIPCPPSGCVVSSGTLIAVTAGATTTGIDFSLVPLGRINGTVKDVTTGLAINGARVEAYRADGTLAESGTTNASGVYDIFFLTPGTYTVRTRINVPFYVDNIFNHISCDVACPLSAGQGVSVTGGDTTTGINFNLAPALGQVRVMYLRPSDRPFRAEFLGAIQNAIYDLRAWYEEQMNGVTFSLSSARPELCVLPHPASYYPGDTRTKVSADVLTCAPAGSGPTRSLWVLYADVEDACNDPGRLGVGLLGITWLGSGDMHGLIGEPVIDSCGAQFFQPPGRYIGGAGHEIGHGFDLPHPAACVSGLPSCESNALMWLGYIPYPATFLRGEEITFLASSPMFRVNNLLQNSRFSSGASNWQLFASPNPFDIVWHVNNGVLEFYRNPPLPGTSNQAVVLQTTDVALAPRTGLLTQFSLGNSSAVRKRIAVIVHDLDFSDLSVCTFWLPAGAPMRHYSMRTHTTRNWTHPTVSFYAATTGTDGGYYRLDRVSMGIDNMMPTINTECVDPIAPIPATGVDGAELLTNGDFSGGSTTGWSVFGQIVPQLTNGVFEFFRPLATPDPAGGILQITNTPLAAGEMLRAQFDLGNSSTVRKRVSVLVHDLDFGDLHACTFWLEPGQPLSTYLMRTFATKAWANVTISIYAASPGDETWTRLDNISLRRTPGARIAGTGCFEPGSPG